MVCYKNLPWHLWPLFVCINFLDTNQANCIEFSLPFPTDTEMLLNSFFSECLRAFRISSIKLLPVSPSSKNLFLCISPQILLTKFRCVSIYKPAWNWELALASAYHANKIIHKPDLCIPSMPFSSSPESEETEHLTNGTQ